MDKWIKRPFLTRGNSNDDLVGNIDFSLPQIVLKKGKKGSWDDWGIHDPVILFDNKGYLVKEGGAMVMYYSGTCGSGNTQGMGRAVSFDDGYTWERMPPEGVLMPKPNSWESDIVSTGWVIKDMDTYRMYYEGATLRKSYKDAIGYAESKDGINFKRPFEYPIIRGETYKDIDRRPQRTMGTPNVIKTLENKYLMTFEAYALSCNSKMQIFGALSDDGINFEPFNDGYPIFNYKNVQSWPVTHVANPRITVIDDRKIYMLVFNGCHDDGYYSLGIAYSKDLLNWKEHAQNPILIPTGYPMDHPFSGRYEGGFFVKDDLFERKKNIRFYHIAIPIKGPSHYNSGIILIQAGKKDGDVENYHFPRINRDDIHFIRENEVFEIKKTDNNVFPATTHFLFKEVEESICGVNFKIKLGSMKHDVFINLNNRLSFLDTSDGVKIRIKDNSIKLFKTKAIEIYKKIIRRLYRKFSELMISHNRVFRWKYLGNVDNHDWINFEIVNNDGEISLKIDGRKLVINKFVKPFEIKCLSFICKEGHLKIKDIRYMLQ